MPPPFPPEQSVPIGDSPGKSVSPAMLVLQQLHPLRLLFTVFLPYSFSRWASLSDKRLDLSLSSLSFLPRTASLRQPIYIHTCLFFLQLPHLSLTLEPESTRTPHSGEPRLVKTRCVSRGRVMASICTSMPSQLTLDSGSRWVAKGGKHASGKWRWA